MYLKFGEEPGGDRLVISNLNFSTRTSRFTLPREMTVKVLTSQSYFISRPAGLEPSTCSIKYQSNPLFLPVKKAHISEPPKILSSSFRKTMEFSTFNSSSWNSLLASPLLFPYYVIPENYVHWTETPESHIYSADLPGVKKEEIRVEVEDLRYLIIRTEAVDELTKPARSFIRKFRLPGMVDINAISAGYEDGVLTVKVPRSFVRRGFFIEPADLPERLGLLARAA